MWLIPVIFVVSVVTLVVVKLKYKDLRLSYLRSQKTASRKQ